jgi:signal transduction histidine kinase
VPFRSFAVDASLLQELGEQLIGRAPIALAELAKNAYDADASTCRIEFGEDVIVVTDDGIGMSADQFLEYWLRLGTTHKVDDRTSPLGRSLTGRKGIGRLSVQFLADEMVLESTSTTTQDKSLWARVDWSTIVRGKDLATVQIEYETRPPRSTYANESSTGTRITLRKLKNVWDSEALEQLGREVWRLRSPFLAPSRAKGSRRPEEFDIQIVAPQIANARESFDKARDAFFDNWRARIKGVLDNGLSGGKATITIDFKAGYPERARAAAEFSETIEFPIRRTPRNSLPLVDHVRFQIFVYNNKGKQPGGIAVNELRGYLAEYGNVSVYDGGFRLPYYGGGRDAAGQDWLLIAQDQGRRINESELLPEKFRTQNRYMQDLPAPGRIFGAVDIDTSREATAARRTKVMQAASNALQIASGRDRLKDNPAFYQLRDLVRAALDLYANRYRLRALKAIDQQRATEPLSRKYDRVQSLLERHRKVIPAAVVREIAREVWDARKAGRTEERALDRRAALFGPLATAGMMGMALAHELAREIQLLKLTSSKLRRFAKSHGLEELSELAKEIDEAQGRLSALRLMFAPLVSSANSESTERLRVRPIVTQAVDALKTLMPGVTFDLSGIPKDLYFPLGALVEWNAILQNVLTNAWNAMLDSSDLRIKFDGGRSRPSTEWLRVSDTGVGLGVPLKEAEQLFEPFERRLVIPKTKQSIALGGQGLGLAIVRMMAARRSAAAEFVEPELGFATTFRLSWRGARQ